MRRRGVDDLEGDDCAGWLQWRGLPMRLVTEWRRGWWRPRGDGDGDGDGSTAADGARCARYVDAYMRQQPPFVDEFLTVTIPHTQVLSL
mgnify:CR=1 FL=1